MSPYGLFQHDTLNYILVFSHSHLSKDFHLKKLYTRILVFSQVQEYTSL